MAQNSLFSKYLIVSSITLILIIVPQIKSDQPSTSVSAPPVADVPTQSGKILNSPPHDPIKCLLAHKEYKSIEFTYSASCECGFQILQETHKTTAWFGLQGPRKLNHLKCNCPDLPKGCFHEKYQEIVIENLESKTPGTSITYKILLFFHYFCIFIGYLAVFISITFGLAIVIHKLFN